MNILPGTRRNTVLRGIGVGAGGAQEAAVKLAIVIKVMGRTGRSVVSQHTHLDTETLNACLCVYILMLSLQRTAVGR